MSSVVSIFIFLFLFALISNVSYIVARRKLPNRVLVSLLVVLLVVWGWALWIADLTTLQMASEGIYTTNSFIPTASSQVPSLFFWIISFLALFVITAGFVNGALFDKPVTSRILIYSLVLGLIGFFAFALIYILKGTGSTFGGFYVLGLYHTFGALVLTCPPTAVILKILFMIKD